MPRYIVDVSITIDASVTVEAESEADARENWWKTALEEVKLALAEEVRCLDEWEFDIDHVTPLEPEENDDEAGTGTE